MAFLIGVTSLLANDYIDQRSLTDARLDSRHISVQPMESSVVSIHFVFYAFIENNLTTASPSLDPIYANGDLVSKERYFFITMVTF